MRAAHDVMEARDMIDLYASIGAILAVLAGFVYAYFKGASAGKKSEKHAHQAQESARLEEENRIKTEAATVIQKIKEARDAQSDSDIVDSLIADSVRKQDNT